MRAPLRRGASSVSTVAQRRAPEQLKNHPWQTPGDREFSTSPFVRSQMVTPNPGEQNQERLLSEAIARRRATPSFDGSPVPDKVLLTIVHAGIEAPSGFNLQPWRFIVVRDTEQKRRLREAAMGQAKVEEAGAVIVCCGDLNAPRGQNLEDVLAEATQHGFSEEQNKKMRETLSSVFGGPAGNMMGLA